MEPFPFKVTIMIPTEIPLLHGRDSTGSPYGLISSFRLPRPEVAAIDQAVKIIDFDITRSGFIRMSSYRVATEIIKHHERYLQEVREKQNERTN